MNKQGIGASVLRKEDRRFVTGRGRYVGDLITPFMLRAVFLRSPCAHARVTVTGAREALQQPGVAAAPTGAEMKAGMPISGIFELEPLVHTSINKGPGMDVPEAVRESPLFMEPATDAPQLVIAGGDETPEFKRQSDAYVEKFATATRKMERYDVPDSNHFRELEHLAEADSPVFQKSLALITG